MLHVMLLHSMHDYYMFICLAFISNCICLSSLCSFASVHLTFVLRQFEIVLIQCVMTSFILPSFFRPNAIIASSMLTFILIPDGASSGRMCPFLEMNFETSPVAGNLFYILLQYRSKISHEGKEVD